MEVYNELNEFAKACEEKKIKKAFIDVRPGDEKMEIYVISCTAKADDLLAFQEVVKSASVKERHEEIAKVLAKAIPNLISGAITK